MRIRFFSAAMLLSTLFLAGCRFHVDKGKNGEDKNVRIDTPVGGLHVRSDQTSAADLGFGVYPGAQIAPDNQGDKSADIHMGFGPWQMRVRVVTYHSSDPQDKVLAWYKQSMGHFGDVLECDGNQPVGSPTVTSEGLTCREDNHVHVNNNGHDAGLDSGTGLSLRAGSRHHQHVLAFKTTAEGTKFTLIELELPGSGKDQTSQTSD